MNENKIIQNMIYEIRGQKIMLDSDLAVLYGVLTKNLNKAVKRNINKFPVEFMFQLTKEEWEYLKYQFSLETNVVPNWNHLDKFKYRPSLPYVFTEHGVLMTANILNSEKANIISVEIIKAFIKFRNFVHSHIDTNEKILELRRLLMLHIDNSDFKFSEYNKTIKQVVIAINNLIEKPKETKKMGF